MGVKRGWKILKINGRTIDGSKQGDIDYLNDVFFGTGQNADFEFRKLDGTNVALRIPKGGYLLNTVLYRNVYTYGAKKIGYFVQYSNWSSFNYVSVGLIFNF